MALCRACVHFFCCLAFVTGLSVSAQNPNYHVEVSGGPPNYRGQPPDKKQPRWVSLVNDSDKSIEAFEMLDLRSDGRFCAEMRSDALLSSSWIHNVPGMERKQFLERGGRWDLGFVTTNPDGTECEPRVPAVIFADGSYEGNEGIVRKLKASRDGEAAALGDWSRQMRSWNQATQTLDDLRDEVESRLQLDKPKLPMLPASATSPNQTETEALLGWYWEGRHTIDLWLKTRLVEFSENGTAASRAMYVPFVLRSVDALKTKIDTDASMRVLNVEFPPISDPDETSDGSSARR